MCRAYGSLIAYVFVSFNGLKSVATKWFDATHLWSQMLLIRVTKPGQMSTQFYSSIRIKYKIDDLLVIRFTVVETTCCQEIFYPEQG